MTKENIKKSLKPFIIGVGKIMVKYHKDIVKEASHFYAKEIMKVTFRASDKRTSSYFRWNSKYFDIQTDDAFRVCLL